VSEELLTGAEVARRLGISPKVVQTMIDYKQLPSVPVGTRRRVPASAVEELKRIMDAAASLVHRSFALTPPRPPTSKEHRP
jgi:excisionase family DNA binding protein